MIRPKLAKLVASVIPMLPGVGVAQESPLATNLFEELVERAAVSGTGIGGRLREECG